MTNRILPSNSFQYLRELQSVYVVNDTVTGLGTVLILSKHPLVALFCSVQCPGEPIIRAYDFSRELRDNGLTVMGGFQSPVEKDCLDILLRGTQPVIICPARSLHNMLLPATWKRAVKEGRLLLLSPFEEGIRRPTVEISEKRNEFVVGLADMFFFAYAKPGGKTEVLAKKAVASGKPVFTFDIRDNTNLIELGAEVIDIEQLVKETGKPDRQIAQRG